jgi:uncharacterized protein (DUF362 family)
MARSVVSVIKATPETVLDDVARAMRNAGFGDAITSDVETCLKINVTWHLYMPGTSSTPWQLEGVVRALLESGFPASSLWGVHNDTVVVDSRAGEVANKQKPVCDKYGVRRVFLNDPGQEWITYEPKEKMLVLADVYRKDGIRIPKFLVGKNIIHLPTVKTHVFTTITGAMKNAFGGLLHFHRHWTHSVIHETLVDLLRIQKDIHPGIFAVTDGIFCGDGPGPRAIRPHVKGYMLASADQVAIDAVSAKMMGFDPFAIKFIRLAHDAGLGTGDVREIEVRGEDISGIDFGFRGDEDTFASRGQKAIYHGPLKPFEKFLLQSPLVPWSYAASKFFHDIYWYPTHGKKRVETMLNETEWGRLFRDYEKGLVGRDVPQTPERAEEDV